MNKLDAWFAKQDRKTYAVVTVGMTCMLLGGISVCFGIFLKSKDLDECGDAPYFIYIGAYMFLISLIGFLGLVKSNPMLLWIYQIMMEVTAIVLFVYTVAGLVISSHDPGRHVAGLRYKEYRLQDCSSWFIKMLNNNHKWKKIKSCYLRERECDAVSKYRTPEQFKLLKLGPIPAGCCRPPSECGYPVTNVSYYDLHFEPNSTNKDCKIYNNSDAIKCFDCDSCKAGVAQEMRSMWLWSSIENVLIFFTMIIFINCIRHVRQKAETARQERTGENADEMLQIRI